MVDDHEEMIHELKVLYVWHVVLVIDDIVKRLSFFFSKKRRRKSSWFHTSYSCTVQYMCMYVRVHVTTSNIR